MLIIYPDEFTRELQLFLGCVLIVFNLAAYLLVWCRFRTREVNR